MGQSTDGILVYGVDFGEEPESFPWYDDESGVDIEEWWYAQNGLSNDHLWVGWEEFFAGKPYKSHNEKTAEYEAAHPGWREALDENYEKRRALRIELPIEVVYHCSGDYPMYILAVPGSKKRASRGETVTIDELYVPAQKVELAQQFLAEHGIDFDPQWLLCSYWG